MLLTEKRGVRLGNNLPLFIEELEAIADMVSILRIPFADLANLTTVNVDQRSLQNMMETYSLLGNVPVFKLKVALVTLL
jgi:hypothetical protein